MNKINMIIWNRKFEITIDYNCFPGENILSEQIETINDFCGNENPTDGTLKAIVDYVKETSNGKLGSSEIDNIFKYVIPKIIYVPRSKNHILAIICNYKFDMENGIAVVFKDNMLMEIGTQDIIL